MEIYVNTLPTGFCIYSKYSIFRIRPVFILRNALQFYSFNQSLEEEETSHIELFFHVFTTLEMADGETPRWRADPANSWKVRENAHLSKTCTSRFIIIPFHGGLSSLCLWHEIPQSQKIHTNMSIATPIRIEYRTNRHSQWHPSSGSGRCIAPDQSPLATIRRG